MKAYEDALLVVHIGDCRAVMDDMAEGSVDCVVTSPPYWGMRDYGELGQFGLESTPEAYVASLVGVFRSVRRVLRDEGTVWLVLGDVYAAQRGATAMPAQTVAGGVGGKSENPAAFRGMSSGKSAHRNASAFGLKHKDLVGIPWRVAFALQADGWYLRSDIIWSKPNPMPESVIDRPTKAHEYVFMLSKSMRYYFDSGAVRERSASGDSFRNLRSVWSIATKPYRGAHFATFPEKLVEPCIKAGCPVGGVVLDPFCGSGTVACAANRLDRRAVLIDLSADYAQLALRRNGRLS